MQLAPNFFHWPLNFERYKPTGPQQQILQMSCAMVILLFDRVGAWLSEHISGNQRFSLYFEAEMKHKRPGVLTNVVGCHVLRLEDGHVREEDDGRGAVNEGQAGGE